MPNVRLLVNNMDAEALYTLTVPCVPESLAVLEGLCENYIHSTDAISEQAALVIRLAVAEACRNALKQQHPHGGVSVTTLTILRQEPHVEDNTLQNLVLEIQDPGPGLLVAGRYPPYPVEMHNQLYVLQEVLGQTIIARVDDAHSITLLCMDEAESGGLTRRERIQKMSDHGLGLLALIRTWGRVQFFWSRTNGNTVRLKNPILNHHQNES